MIDIDIPKSIRKWMPILEDVFDINLNEKHISGLLSTMCEVVIMKSNFDSSHLPELCGDINRIINSEKNIVDILETKYNIASGKEFFKVKVSDNEYWLEKGKSLLLPILINELSKDKYMESLEVYKKNNPEILKEIRLSKINQLLA